MDMPTFQRESALNREAYGRLRQQIRREYAGQYVVLAHGRILGSAMSYAKAMEIVDRLPERPEYYLIFASDEEPRFELVYDLSGSA